jgi:hypothetical protein
VGQGVKWLGAQRIYLADISNLEEILEERVSYRRRILRLARSISEIGVLHEPIVRKSDMLAITGGDRIAALHFNKRLKARVKLVECDDDEADVIRDAENAARRHNDTAELVATGRVLKRYAKEAEERWIRDMAKREALERMGILPAKKRGRPRSPKTMALEELAAATGVTVATLRQRDRRRRRAQMSSAIDGSAEIEEGTVKDVAKDRLPNLQRWGMEVPEDFRKAVQHIRVVMLGIGDRLLEAQNTMHHINCKDALFPPALAKRLFTDLQELRRDVSLSAPVAICPYCKNLGGVQEQCGACVTTGWISERQLASVPEELKVIGQDAMVMYEGSPVLVSELVETETYTDTLLGNASEDDGLPDSEEADPEDQPTAVVDDNEDLFA